ncbi:MAG: outer membrane protein assembly factor BamB family protein [Alphaproteobacteria bacterium]
MLSLLLFTGCSGIGAWFGDDEDPPLPGDRISVLELQSRLEPDDAALSAEGLVTPAPWRNEFWPQAGGYPNHAMQNLDLGTNLKPVWKADIGEGGTDRIPLTAQPVLVDNRIFTLDQELMLSAFDTKTGKQLWRQDVSTPKEDDIVIGGGIAYASNKIFVTNGYNEVLALNPGDGKILWRKNTGSPSRAAPTIMDGRLYVTTVENKLLALNATDGTLLWEYAGVSETAGLVGAASPGANHALVVPVFTSGEIMALRVENGSVAWADNLSTVRNFGGVESLADIKAMPVMEKGIIVAISFGGRLVALDERTGTRIWQREIGGINTPWLAGNHLFVLSLNNELIALGRETGSIRWVMKLPRMADDEPLIFAGPVLAGGRLIAVGSDGRVIEVDPVEGKLLREWDAGDEIHIAPIVAGGTLYLLSEDGMLTAYR